MAAPSMGHQVLVGMGATTTINEWYNCQSFGVKRTQDKITDNAFRGTRSRHTDRVREGLIDVRGGITLAPCPSELDNLLPRILGGTEAADVFALAETLPTFSCAADRGPRNFRYDSCKVNQATFRSRPGEPLILELDIIGVSANQNDSGIAWGSAATQDFYVHHDLDTGTGFLHNAVEYDTKELTIVISNNLVDDDYMQTQTRSQLPEGDRQITVSWNGPFTADEVALLDSLTKQAASIGYNNGTNSCTFTFASLRGDETDPDSDGRDEITQTIEFEAFETDAAKELVVTSTNA